MFNSLKKINSFLYRYYGVTLKNFLFVLLLVSFLILTYISVKFFLASDPILTFLNILHNYYLKFIISSGTEILKSFSFSIYTKELSIFLNNELLITAGHKFITFRWTILLIFIIILTPVEFWRKIKWILLSLLVNPIVYIFKIVFWVVVFSNTQLDFLSAGKVAQILVHLGYFLFIILWINSNYKKFFSQYNLSTQKLYKEKYATLILAFFLIILINDFFLAVFSFRPYVSFLFNSTAYLLNLFGYESYVDQNYLRGPGGYIHMAKFCMGLNTMSVFTVFIFLTGKNYKKIISFTLIGLLLINLVNILRFFFIFIHIQNNEGYKLTIEVHDLLDLIIYSFIFVLWILWLEKYTDIWTFFKKKAAEN